MRGLLYGLCVTLYLFGCGQPQEDTPPPDISVTSVLWQGYPQQDTSFSFQQKFSETMQCLNRLNVYHEGEPYVTVVKDAFICEGHFGYAGCYFNGVIYVSVDVAESRTPTIDGHDMFKHEVVHWATGLGDEAHNDNYFTQCS